MLETVSAKESSQKIGKRRFSIDPRSVEEPKDGKRFKIAAESVLNDQKFVRTEDYNPQETDTKSIISEELKLQSRPKLTTASKRAIVEASLESPNDNPLNQSRSGDQVVIKKNLPPKTPDRKANQERSPASHSMSMNKMAPENDVCNSSFNLERFKFLIFGSMTGFEKDLKKFLKEIKNDLDIIKGIEHKEPCPSKAGLLDIDRSKLTLLIRR